MPNRTGTMRLSGKTQLITFSLSNNFSFAIDLTDAEDVLRFLRSVRALKRPINLIASCPAKSKMAFNHQTRKITIYVTDTGVQWEFGLDQAKTIIKFLKKAIPCMRAKNPYPGLPKTITRKEVAAWGLYDWRKELEQDRLYR